MKVLVLNNDFRAYWKGRLLFLYNYLSAMAGFEFFAIELFGKGSPYDFDGYNNTQQWWTCLFPDKSANDLTLAEIKSGVFKALDALKPDVVIAPSIVFFAGALGIKWAKKNHSRFIMFDDAKPNQVQRNFVVQWIKNTIIAQADSLWLPSAFYDVEYKHFLQKGIHFFYGFSSVDNNQFKPVSAYRGESNVFICVARLVPIKNLTGLLNAWQQVEQQNNTASLMLVGDGPEKQALQQQVLTLGLTRVSFSGALSNDGLPMLFAAADAFILPSFSETWGLVVNEAMAAGLPVLLSRNINAMQSLLKENVNGFSFDPLNADDIAGAVLKFASLDRVQRKAMSAASMQLVSEMSYEAMGTRLLAALSIINKSKFKKPGVLAAAIINKWNGRYNTYGWDKL